ncbi:hypothetical protein [Streptomyces chartreusis]|uniref:hypothetical protein n=1 Tax=Streptomyces chartreusis TaxID=1969 RepID=UPI003625DECF
MNNGHGPSGRGPINGNDITITAIAGQRVLVIQPVIPDAAPEELKNGLAIRRTANTTGICPGCGARMAMPNRAERRVARRAGKIIAVVIAHDDDCPALLGGGRL